MSSAPQARAAAPSGEPALWLLIRVNALQACRRLAAIRRQSRLLSALILLFVVGYAALAFWFFRHGLRFIHAFPGLGSLLLERLVYLLFAFLFILLLFSNLVISYTNLFRNRETLFLLALPVPASTLFQWKLLESALLASWAFLFLISPLLLAFGLDRGVAWHFYLITPCLIALFVVLPAVLGAWAAVTVARLLDRRTFQVMAVAAAAILLTAAALWLRTETITDEMLETRVLSVLDRLLAKTRFAQFAWLPSYWLSAGLLQWAEGARSGAAFFAMVLLSYALFLGGLAFSRTGRPFYEAISAVQSRGGAFWRWPARRLSSRPGMHRQRRGVILERTLARMCWLPMDLRTLWLKDFRVFWRDTTQWGQTLVLFGLLGAYILNLRHFSQQLANPFWVYLVSYLNLGACSLNLATLTTRFVFPQFSLEGRRLWIVGMAPIGLPRLLMAKYWLATVASLAITLGLILLSCRMLLLPASRTLYFAGAVTVMTFTLNGLATGLGALYPNFRDDNPSKVVSGFGGTFCLVSSFLYIVVSVVVLAWGSPWGWRPGTAPDPWLTLASCAAFGSLSFALGYLPLHLGLRRVTRLEV